MNIVQYSIRQWNTFWFTKGSPYPLAVMRIAVGIFLLLQWGVLLPDIPMLLSNKGLLMPLYEHSFFTSIPSLFLGPSPFITWILYGILIIGIIGFTIGIHMRISALVILIISGHYFYLNLYSLPSTGHYLTYFFLMILTCSEADHVLTMHKKQTSSNVSLLPQRLIAVHISALYIGVSAQKVLLADWQGGEILYYSFQSSWAWPLAWWIVQLPLPMMFYDVIVFFIKSFQIILPFGLWHKKTQRWWVLGGALFHLSIFMLMGIWEFIVLIPLYSAFIDPKIVEGFLKKYVYST